MPNCKPFPGVIGAIDGTQINVSAHGIANRESYRNRKGHIALNVQAICDANLIFLDVVARWPGSVHDSRIFNNSLVCVMLENKELSGWLIGDSGYPSRTYMTPITAP